MSYLMWRSGCVMETSQDEDYRCCLLAILEGKMSMLHSLTSQCSPWSGREEGEEPAKNVGLASGFAGLMARPAEGDAYVLHFVNTCFSGGLVSHKSPADIAKTDSTYEQHASNPRRNTYAFQTKDAQHIILVPQSM